MIVCSDCGSTMEDDLQFCTECGMQNPSTRKTEIMPAQANNPRQEIGRPPATAFPNAPTIGSQLTPSGSSAPGSLVLNQPPMPVAPQAQSNRTVFVVMFAIAATLVLLLIGGIGSQLLLSGRNQDAAPNNSQPPAAKNDTAPLTGKTVTTNTERSPSLTNGYASVEEKVANGDLLTVNDLTGLSAADLKLLRNTIFARHGRLFTTPELQRYFSNKSWYAPRGDYSDEDLSSNDRDNRNLILAAEKGAR